MNRRFVFWTALTAVLMMSVVAFGQRQGQRGQRGFGMMGRGMGVAQLIRIEAVQKELNVTDEQMTKLRGLASSARGGQSGERRNFRDMTDEERKKLREEMTKRMKELQEKVAGILDKEQLERLEQIRIQALRFRAFRDSTIAKKLDITDEQKEKMTAGMREASQAMRDAFSGGDRPSREKMMEMFGKMNAKMDEAVKKILTDEQKAAYKKMIGKPFDVSKLRPQRRPRRDI